MREVGENVIEFKPRSKEKHENEVMYEFHFVFRSTPNDLSNIDRIALYANGYKEMLNMSEDNREMNNIKDRILRGVMESIHVLFNNYEE